MRNSYEKRFQALENKFKKQNEQLIIHDSQIVEEQNLRKKQIEEIEKMRIEQQKLFDKQIAQIRAKERALREQQIEQMRNEERNLREKQIEQIRNEERNLREKQVEKVKKTISDISSDYFLKEDISKFNHFREETQAVAMSGLVEKNQNKILV
ncbi:hypothetical protein M9Y10_041362 [Tritrichomonas musculus]|uniref:Meiosis-specific nuclear structural protein 1 n=1 Tax=Tritrichomonas musculus TaxID=1915356 RepID=A0ABR2K775_9EUKA